ILKRLEFPGAQGSSARLLAVCRPMRRRAAAARSEAAPRRERTRASLLQSGFSWARRRSPPGVPGLAAVAATRAVLGPARLCVPWRGGRRWLATEPPAPSSCTVGHSGVVLRRCGHSRRYGAEGKASGWAAPWPLKSASRAQRSLSLSRSAQLPVPPSMALSIFSVCIFVSKPTSVHGRCRLLVDVFSLCSGPQPPRRSPRLPSPPPFLPVSPLPRPAQRRRTRADVHGRARHGRDNLHYETCSDDRCMSQPFLSLRTPPQLPRRPTPALAAIGLLPGNGFEMAHWGGGRHADASDRSYSEAGRQQRGAAGGTAKQRPGGGSGWLNSAKGQRSSLNSTQCLASAILCWTPELPSKAIAPVPEHVQKTGTTMDKAKDDDPSNFFLPLIHGLLPPISTSAAVLSPGGASPTTAAF
ncbi:hypothetical protein U9M48_029342, partial [Paspalum notatum var. saurae]